MPTSVLTVILRNARGDFLNFLSVGAGGYGLTDCFFFAFGDFRPERRNVDEGVMEWDGM